MSVRRVVTTGDAQAEERFACPLDGPPSEEISVGETRTRRVRRDGDVVVWEVEKRPDGGIVTTVTERWSLSTGRS